MLIQACLCVFRLLLLPKFGSPFPSPFFIKNTQTHTNSRIIKCIFFHPASSVVRCISQHASVAQLSRRHYLSHVGMRHELCLTYTHSQTHTQKHTYTLSPWDCSSVFMPVLDEEMLETFGSLESMLTTSISPSISLLLFLPQLLSVTRPFSIFLLFVVSFFSGFSVVFWIGEGIC